MFNPALAIGIWTVVLLGIAMWAMATREGEDMEIEDFSYFASKQEDEAAGYRHTG